MHSLVDSCLDGDNLHSFAVRLPCFSSNTVDHYIAKDRAKAQSGTPAAAEAAHGEGEGAGGRNKAEAVEESEWYEKHLVTQDPGEFPQVESLKVLTMM